MRRLARVIFVERHRTLLGVLDRPSRLPQDYRGPEGEQLGFATVQAGKVEVMYQSRASVVGDLPALA